MYSFFPNFITLGEFLLWEWEGYNLWWSCDVVSLTLRKRVHFPPRFVLSKRCACEVPACSSGVNETFQLAQRMATEGVLAGKPALLEFPPPRTWVSYWRFSPVTKKDALCYKYQAITFTTCVTWPWLNMKEMIVLQHVQTWDLIQNLQIHESELIPLRHEVVENILVYWHLSIPNCLFKTICEIRLRSYIH